MFNSIPKSLLAGLLGSLLFTSLNAASVTTDPVGYVTVDVLSGTDTIISTPFNGSYEFTGNAASYLPASDDVYTVNLSVDPNWSSDTYADSYFFRFRDGEFKGQYFTIVSNTSNTLSVDSLGQDFSLLSGGESFDIQKFPTLGSVFPPETTNLTASTGNLSFQRGSVILIPDYSGAGINQSSRGSFFFTEAEGWKENTSGFPLANDFILYPDSYVVIRQSNQFADTKLTLTGTVDVHALSSFLSSLPNGQQDTFQSINRPIPVTLAESGLSSALISSSGNLSFQRKDTVLYIDNTARGLNKSASRVFYHINGSWFENTSGFPSADDFVLEPSAGIVIRRAATNDGSTVVYSLPELNI